MSPLVLPQVAISLSVNKSNDVRRSASLDDDVAAVLKYGEYDRHKSADLRRQRKERAAHSVLQDTEIRTIASLSRKWPVALVLNRFGIRPVPDVETAGELLQKELRGIWATISHGADAASKSMAMTELLFAASFV